MNTAERPVTGKIAVVMAPDDAYTVHAGVAILSILRASGQPQNFHFYLLRDRQSLSTENIRQLRDIAASYNAGLDDVLVERPILEGKTTGHYLPANAFYRILIPDLLPELDRCIYLDCDLVALDDLALLWQEDISQVAVGVVRDWHVEGRGLGKYEQIRYYFNSGVLYMNLRKCRERHYVEECLKLMEVPKFTERYSDQDVLNLVFSNDLLLLHPRWNIQTGQELLCKLCSIKSGNAQWREVEERPGIAHYSGRKRKPWLFDMKHRLAMAYWDSFRHSPWRGSDENITAALAKAVAKNRIARWHDVIRHLLLIKITPKRGIYRLVFLGITCINIMPSGKKKR
ncbi:MAG: glycosyltransferase family 8 protein [Verrucomicrobiales bacterium]|jgi:lipopolysaccharide biosynthesis glycosyltransferase|nr:glycosyltransferase family 8 protein [Verrucomicrobiales bacterium]